MSIFDPEPAASEQKSDQKKERPGGRLVLVLVLLLALLIGGGYAGAYAFAGEKVPRGTTIAGIDIGGKTPSAAATALENGLGDRLAAPIKVNVNGEPAGELDASKVGLAVDFEESVRRAGGGRSWEPERLWDYYTGGDDLEAVVEVDDAALRAEVETLTQKFVKPARDGQVLFRKDKVVTEAAVLGEAVDFDAAREGVLAAYLSEKSEADLELVQSDPEIDDDDVQTALDDFANPAMSAPVTLLFDDSPVRLAPRDYGSALSMKPENGMLKGQVDTKRLQALVAGATSAKDAPVDATVRLVKGKPRVVPAKPGVTFDPGDVNTTFLDLVTRAEGERELKVDATVAKPDFTTAQARGLKIRRMISEESTNYPHADYRNINIGRAAEIIDGTVLKPGETFSLNDTVGERTRENGFTEGFVISNGILVRDLGGGVSQMATTLFNGMFFAGLEDIEHKPHSFYIDRYPVGREATVAWGSVDLRFRNDSPYGVLIQAVVDPSTPSTQGTVTVRMFSTKVWDIESETSARYAYVAPKTRTLTTPDCEPNTGFSGFQVDVTRIFRKAGESAVAKTEKFHTNYTAADTVICKPPPAPPGG